MDIKSFYKSFSTSANVSTNYSPSKVVSSTQIAELSGNKVVKYISRNEKYLPMYLNDSTAAVNISSLTEPVQSLQNTLSTYSNTLLADSSLIYSGEQYEPANISSVTFAGSYVSVSSANFSATSVLGFSAYSTSFTAANSDVKIVYKNNKYIIAPDQTEIIEYNVGSHTAVLGFGVSGAAIEFDETQSVNSVTFKYEDNKITIYCSELDET